MMKIIRTLGISAMLLLMLTSCDPQVYGSVGVSSGWSDYGGSRVHGSISVGGRIH